MAAHAVSYGVDDASTDSEVEREWDELESDSADAASQPLPKPKAGVVDKHKY